MPSTRPCAAFEPISPTFDIKALVESTPNFEWVVRIHCDMIDHQGLENFEKLVLIHVILGGRPLVIEGYDERLDRWTFALQWLKDNVASKVENARDLTKKTNVLLSIGHYLSNMALLTNHWTDRNYKDPDRQRMYLKDIDCPQLWHEKLRDTIPPGLFYLNETTGDVGGLGAIAEADPPGPGMKKGRGVAKAGDLMSSLPKEMRAENMMCYIGHEGTYTPSHREMCASLGQNIMVETSTGAIEDGKPTKPGSSIWFMTESKEREVVSEYWLSKLGHDIEVENHFAQVNAWRAAPFKTYVVEQRTGDFILIPPLAPHQVWNRGTRTMKVAWNRTTIETLEMALNEALPRARMVCRDEQYKNKAIIYYSLQKYSKALKIADKQRQKKPTSKMSDAKVRQVEKDFRRLQALFTEIMVSESFLPSKEEKKVDFVPFESFITCSYCRCNIFNRFLTCPSCIEPLENGEEDTYDICMECYAMGRSCACISKLKWVEQFPWNELMQNHESWRHHILRMEGKVTDKSPKSLKTELERLGGRRTLAQICQRELIRRPFRDIKKPPPAAEEIEREDEVKVDANGNLKKKGKIRRSEKFTREHARCHVDCHWEPKWKQAQCSNCDKNYCYGVLFRAYDIMPQDILADPRWKCPSCRNICSCRHCRIKPGYKPFTPSGTMLGHNTKAVADPRSVESLVDFSFSNIAWIQKAGDDHSDDTRRIQKRQKAAEKAMNKETELGDNYVQDGASDVDEVEDNILRLGQHEGIIPIDPTLASMGTPTGASQDDEDYYEENPEDARKSVDYMRTIPTVLQHVVPDGGIIRDFEHVYDTTEAITYEYPDPDATRPPASTEEPQQIQGSYEAVMSTSPDRIEMIARKRKHEKVDEGDKSYGSHKAKKPIMEKPTTRKSLIVKFKVPGERLDSMNTMAMIAQKALNGVADAPAPVVSSDLRALNAIWDGAEGQPLPKKGRVDQIDIDVDDDFTPSRYQERRKGDPNQSLRPPPDSEITRRTTRMQGVTYEDPSDEDEFLETLAERPNGTKLAVIERTDIDTAQESDLDQSEEQNIDPNLFDAPSPIVFDTGHNTNQAADIADAFGGVFDSVLSQSAPKPHFSTINASPSAQPNGAAKLVSNSHPKPTEGPKAVAKTSKVSSEVIAHAQANRKAKLAALEWAEAENDSFGDDWSEEGRMSPPKKPNSESIRSIKEREGVSNIEPPISQPVREAVKADSAQRASAAEWGQDSSDEDSDTPPSRVQPSLSGAAVNGPRNSNMKAVVAQGQRGRPPRSRH